MGLEEQAMRQRQLSRGVNRQGVTPIIAIVMLLFLVIIAVSGFAMFLNELLDAQWEDIRQQTHTETQFRHLACNDHPNQGDTIDFLVKNTGETTIDTADVDVYVRAISDGRLIDMLSASGDTLDPGDHWRETLALGSSDFKAGHAYLIELEFTSNEGTSTIRQCTARRVIS